VAGFFRRGAHGGFGCVSGESRQSEAPTRRVLEGSARGFPVAEQSSRHHAGKHAVARGMRRLRMAVWPALFGQLRQGDEQRSFGNREPLRLVAEISERSGANAFEVAAIGRQRQVALEDFALGQPPLNLDGAGDLAQLRGDATARARLDQPRNCPAARSSASGSTPLCS
jgi:hypothetical protein